MICPCCLSQDWTHDEGPCDARPLYRRSRYSKAPESAEAYALAHRMDSDRPVPAEGR